ncbi:hypothetical protein [Dysgonomonas sp. 25]|uniref:hypothetical protein n=1 Tax=Dysgonomonas sp. 25 TaxID=2302933 RepID=UPI0013D24FC3|nr:hypothetical protein [Dysgonomonas sp. 25]NDV69963.1 hypothetical protein [Dysgonomonas sp. 25]
MKYIYILLMFSFLCTPLTTVAQFISYKDIEPTISVYKFPLIPLGDDYKTCDVRIDMDGLSKEDMEDMKKGLKIRGFEFPKKGEQPDLTVYAKVTPVYFSNINIMSIEKKNFKGDSYTAYNTFANVKYEYYLLIIDKRNNDKVLLERKETINDDWVRNEEGETWMKFFTHPAATLQGALLPLYLPRLKGIIINEADTKFATTSYHDGARLYLMNDMDYYQSYFHQFETETLAGTFKMEWLADKDPRYQKARLRYEKYCEDLIEWYKKHKPEYVSNVSSHCYYNLASIANLEDDLEKVKHYLSLITYTPLKPEADALLEEAIDNDKRLKANNKTSRIYKWNFTPK